MGDVHFLFVHVFMVLVFALIVFQLLRGLWTWHQNNQLSQETDMAKVITKGQPISGANQSQAVTRYFVTFEFGHGSRKELKVSSNVFAYLAEGDLGKLTYQRTRFISFER